MTTTENLENAAPPRVLFSREAEDALVAACLINPEMFPVSRAIAAPADFYIQKERWIWEAMDALAGRHDPIDLTTVGCELGPDRLKELGGMAFLIALTNLLGSSLNAESYAHTVHNFAVLRKLVRTANEIAAAAYRDGADAEDVLANGNLALRKASLELATGRAHSMPEVLQECSREVAVQAASAQLPGIRTGFSTLDSKLGGGIQPGQVGIVSGFSGGGKSAFLLQAAGHAGRTDQVQFYSLEMSARELAFRLLAQRTGINSQVLKTGRLNAAEWKSFTGAVEQLSQLHICFDDSVPLSVVLLRAKLLRAMADGRLDLVIIDCAGLMHSPGVTEYDQLRELTRDLKVLAMELNLPILVAVQLNRRGHDEDTPQAHHLRGSGTWEQDADVILILHKRNGSPRLGSLLYRLEIAKNRSGPTGFVDLVFKPETTTFEEEG